MRGRTSCLAAVRSFASGARCNYQHSVLFCVISTADLSVHQICETTRLVKLLCSGRGRVRERILNRDCQWESAPWIITALQSVVLFWPAGTSIHAGSSSSVLFLFSDRVYSLSSASLFHRAVADGISHFEQKRLLVEPWWGTHSHKPLLQLSPQLMLIQSSGIPLNFFPPSRLNHIRLIARAI